LLSWGFLLFRLEGHQIVIYAQVLNIIFSALTCYPIYHLGKTIFSEKVGITSAWLWAFFPVAMLMPIEWTWDQSLATLLLACLLSFTYWLRDSTSPLNWSAYGLLWGVAALTNPTLCLLLPFLTLWLFMQRSRRRLPSAALLARFALFFVLALLPWTMRNYFEFGNLMFVKSNFGVELWLGNNPDVKDVYTQQHHPMQDYREYKLLFLAGEPTYNKLKQQQALAFIQQNPETFRRLLWNRFVDTWTGYYDTREGTYVKTLGLLLPFIWMTALYSFVAFLGLLVAVAKKASESLPLVFCAVLFPIPYYITHTSLRYRHPIDPVLTILVVVALSAWLELFTAHSEAHTVVPVECENKHPVLV
jgi:4-amino-4-deoxy-L-arabinose transferase-like glycosyltransferase